jgi:hypothetical protein
MDTSAPSTPRQFPGRLFLWLGLVVGALGPILYVVQLRAERLTAPWYLPILGATGAILALFALSRRWGIVRFLLAGLLVLLAVGEVSLFFTTKLPPYAGPVAVGQPFPAFATTLADGSPLTEANLAGTQPTAIVFFRGRW